MTPGKKWSWQRSLLIGYLVLLGFLVFSFVRVESINREIDHQSAARAISNCEQMNELKRSMMTFYENYPPLLTEDRQIQRDFDLRLDRLKEIALATFQEDDCSRLPVTVYPSATGW